MDVQGTDAARREIACTSTGYHMLTRRKVGLSLASEVLTLHEDGKSSVVSRGQGRPIAWVGKGKIRPSVALAGLVLDSPNGAWVVSTTDVTIDLVGAEEHATPHPHVFVSGDDLAAMAAACGVGSTRKPAPPPMKMTPIVNPMKWVIGLMVVGALTNVGIMLGMRKTSEPEDCTRQRQPVEELYPRLTCVEARAELDRVAKGDAQPRSIVLRPVGLTIDAKDIVGPAKLNCDGIDFDVLDANQANPDAPIVYTPGPHAVLAGVLPDGRLSRPQYVICGNVVAGEKRGELPP